MSTQQAAGDVPRDKSPDSRVKQAAWEGQDEGTKHVMDAVDQYR